MITFGVPVFAFAVLSPLASSQATDSPSVQTDSPASLAGSASPQADGLPASNADRSVQSQTPSASQPSATAAQPPAKENNQQLPMAPSPQLPFGGAKHQLDREEHSEVTLGKVPRNIVRDWAHISVGPLYIRAADLEWLLPLAGASAVAFNTDTHTMTQVVSRDPSFNNINANVSDGLRDGFIAAPILMAGVGMARDNERVRETGLLGSEAVFDAFVMDEIVKVCTFRERPLADNGKGDFYIGSTGGIDSSFVSGHSMVSWASAAVIAGEYHNKWAQAGVYSLATGVSLERVLAQQHFPTDVLLGAAGGWLIGHYVYRAHHHRVLPVQAVSGEPMHQVLAAHLDGSAN